MDMVLRASSVWHATCPACARDGYFGVISGYSRTCSIRWITV